MLIYEYTQTMMIWLTWLSQTRPVPPEPYRPLRTHAPTRQYAHAHARTHAYTHARTRTPTQTHAHAHTCTQSLTHSFAFSPQRPLRTRALTSANTNTPSLADWLTDIRSGANGQIRAHTGANTGANTYARTHIHAYSVLAGAKHGKGGTMGRDGGWVGGGG
jgi:hypothetical protein